MLYAEGLNRRYNAGGWTFCDAIILDTLAKAHKLSRLE
jgi:hypothetical protein